MDPMPALAAAFSPADLAAVGLFLALWALIEQLVRPARGPARSTGEIMATWRLRWFEAAAERDVRIVDSQIVASLRSGVALFISGSLIALGGAIALIGRADQVATIAGDLAGAEAPRAAWTIKILLVIAVLATAFLQFVWSHRVFGYCSVMLGAIPNEPGSPEARAVARRAGLLSIRAARSFNGGLRAIYFALAALAWLVGPAALALAASVTFATLYRREFLSETRRILLEGRAAAGAAPPEAREPASTGRR